MANNQNLKPFKKNGQAETEDGKDPRINRRGRIIGSMDQLKKEWQKIWAEVLTDAQGKPIIDEVTGEKLTRLTARMRIATTSKDNREFRTALEFSWGKPSETVQLTVDGQMKTWLQFIQGEDDNSKSSTDTDTETDSQ